MCPFHTTVTVEQKRTLGVRDKHSWKTPGQDHCKLFVHEPFTGPNAWAFLQDGTKTQGAAWVLSTGQIDFTQTK